MGVIMKLRHLSLVISGLDEVAEGKVLSDGQRTVIKRWSEQGASALEAPSYYKNLLEPSRLKVRAGTTEEWVEHNPILEDGEIGWEIARDKLKVGDGITTWGELNYAE